MPLFLALVLVWRQLVICVFAGDLFQIRRFEVRRTSLLPSAIVDDRWLSDLLLILEGDIVTSEKPTYNPARLGMRQLTPRTSPSRRQIANCDRNTVV